MTILLHKTNRITSSDTLDSDAEVIAENDFQLSKSQQRKLNKGSQTIPNSFPGITESQQMDTPFVLHPQFHY